MLGKHVHARERETDVSEHGVARGCIGRQAAPSPQLRDHANLARAYVALGKAGSEAVQALRRQVATDCGVADASLLSSDPTAPELPLGYPHAPGIIRGWAQRCGRALAQLKARAVVGVETARAQVQTSLRTVTEPHLCAQGSQAKRQGLTRRLPEGGQWIVPTRPLGRRLGQSRDRVIQRAPATRVAMPEVATRLIPQSVPWLPTGVVAKGHIRHAGVTQARALVRHKAGQAVELGLPSLLSRLGGGSLCGTLLRGMVDESKRPWQARAGYRTICGAHATPAVRVSDRGGYATAPLNALACEGVQALGSQPKGHRAWRVAEAVRVTVRSERGKTAGIMGTLKTDQYGFNKPKERLWQTLEMAGPRSILSCNLHKLMRDLVRADR